MHLREITPGISLSQFVRLYRIIDFEFEHNNPIPPKAYTPRPEQCLQFFPTPTIIADAENNNAISPKNALLIGQQTTINNRTVFKRFLSLQIVFWPGVLHRLLGLPAAQLTNQLTDASDVFGNEVEHVNDELYHAQNHEQMIAVAERFMLKVVKCANKDVQPIDLMAAQMLNPTHSLDWYVSNAFLSHRQFDRKFTHRIGVTPKEYLRIIRFDEAYRLKNRYPDMSWFNVAIACGYFDYQHMSKDYKAFTGYTPSAFFAMDSPERLLGTEEIY